MKKLLTIAVLIFYSYLNAFSQGYPVSCWYLNDDDFYHCVNQQAFLDDNTNDYYCVYQISDDCIFFKWNINVGGANPDNHLIGLKAFVYDGGMTPQVFDILDWCKNGDYPNVPAYSNSGKHVYSYAGPAPTNQEDVTVNFIISVVDFNACWYYDAPTHYQYFELDFPDACVPSSPPTGANNENDNNRINSDKFTNSVLSGVYPNIANNYINIVEDNDIQSIEIVGINGVVAKKEIAKSNNDNRYDISALKPGFYIVKIITEDNKHKNYKIIKR